jgi:uncharacterized protein (TIGR00251 family)
MWDRMDALSDDREGTTISIEVSAGAKTNEFPSGYNEWRKAIGCRVTAPAVEGKANKAIIRLVSGVLHVPSSTVIIQSGSTSSQKRVLVTGLSKEELLSRLDPLF